MNRFRFQAMLEEFPFLHPLLDGVDAAKVEIKVKRLDAEMLGFTPTEYSHVGSLVNCWCHDRWYAIVAGEIARVEWDGEPAVISRPNASHRSNYAYDQGWERTGETLLESLARFEEDYLHLPDLLVRDHEYHDDTDGRDLQHEHTITIFKPRKDLSIAAEIERAKLVARLSFDLEAEEPPLGPQYHWQAEIDEAVRNSTSEEVRISGPSIVEELKERGWEVISEEPGTAGLPPIITFRVP